jgi:hypothetical protein
MAPLQRDPIHEAEIRASKMRKSKKKDLLRESRKKWPEPQPLDVAANEQNAEEKSKSNAPKPMVVQV